VKTNNLILNVNIDGQTVRQYFEKRLLNVREENIWQEIHSILKSDRILQMEMLAKKDYHNLHWRKPYWVYAF